MGIEIEKFVTSEERRALIQEFIKRNELRIAGDIQEKIY